MLDQDKCTEGSKEALFQRTIMMSLIARHRLIYEQEATKSRYLDFSVEEEWTCPPMPTREYWMDGRFLTQPKPDLAVSFYRENLIADRLWYDMPAATQRLACYEGLSETGAARAFCFFAIEARKATVSSDDTTGKRQSLNNASQALHNMFEFFRDAGKQHEEKFFTKVRFFSVVASTEGLTIRIHRATREGLRLGLTMSERNDYPLRFEHREFARIDRDNFDRGAVLEIFRKILVGYGVKKLHPLLLEATKAIMEKIKEDPSRLKARSDLRFYRYGQVDITPKSRKGTPAMKATQSTVNRKSLDPPLGCKTKRSAEQGPTENS